MLTTASQLTEMQYLRPHLDADIWSTAEGPRQQVRELWCTPQTMLKEFRAEALLSDQGERRALKENKPNVTNSNNKPQGNTGEHVGLRQTEESREEFVGHSQALESDWLDLPSYFALRLGESPNSWFYLSHPYAVFFFQEKGWEGEASFDHPATSAAEAVLI